MKKIAQIQVARAIAALMVVYYHSYMALRAFDDASAVPLPFLTESGYLGVNLFFIISGFIIGLVTDTPTFRARDFLVKRIICCRPINWSLRRAWGCTCGARRLPDWAWYCLPSSRQSPMR